MADNRRFYSGSCYCGTIRYVIRLHDSTATDIPKDEKYYRCNCTICHKMGYFHMRPMDHKADFYLLSGDPFTTMGNYHPKLEMSHFLFCKTCAIRPFILVGESDKLGEMIDVDLDSLKVDGVANAEGTKTTKVWHTTAEAKYFSANGHTIDANQGFDMRAYVDNKSVLYFNRLVDDQKPIPDMAPVPYPGGCY